MNFIVGFIGYIAVHLSGNIGTGVMLIFNFKNFRFGSLKYLLTNNKKNYSIFFLINGLGGFTKWMSALGIESNERIIMSIEWNKGRGLRPVM